MAGALQRARLDHLGQGKQHHHHRRFRPLADRQRASDCDGHQGVDVQVTVAQRNPALAVSTGAANSDRQQRQSDYRPGTLVAQSQRRKFGQ